MNRRKSITSRTRWRLPLLLLLAGFGCVGLLVVFWPAGSERNGRSPDPAAAAPLPGAPLSPFTAGGWNVGLDDADPQIITQLLADFQGLDLWGLAEVNNQGGAVQLLEQAAEAGEGADFAAVLGASGDAMRLLALYNASRYELLDWQELDAINTTGRARAPLVLHLREKRGGQDFLFMVNHLYRSRDDERLRQAQLLAQWAAEQTLPVIAVGDYNFDWALAGGEADHDRAYDAFTANGIWAWVRPDTLVTTQCSGWPCTYNSVLDFVFTAGPARNWPSRSVIAAVPGDFPDDTRRSDHRAVLAHFAPGGAEGLVQENVALPQQMPSDLLAVQTRTPLAASPSRPPPVETEHTTAPSATSGPLAPASPSVIIASIYYNGVVADVESDEYIVLINQGSQPVNLGGWRINAGDTGQDFVLPDYWLQAGEQARVYTNEVHPASGGLSLRSGKPVWRNAGDCGYLYDPDGVRTSESCY